MQTSINKAGQPIAVAGQLSDNQEGLDVVSAFNEAAGEIAFGLAVEAGAKRDGVQAIDAADDVVVGVNVWGFNHVPGSSGDLGTTGLKQNAGLQILRKGRLYVVVEAGLTIVPNVDRTYVRAVANGGNTVLGAFSNAADGGNTIDLTKVGIFRSGVFTAADGVTKIAEAEFDFTNKP